MPFDELRAGPARLTMTMLLLLVLGVAVFLALLRPYGPLAMTSPCVHLAFGGFTLLQSRGRMWEGATVGALASMAGGIFFHLADSHLDLRQSILILATVGTLGIWIGAALHCLRSYPRVAITSLIFLAVWFAIAAQMGIVLH